MWVTAAKEQGEQPLTDKRAAAAAAAAVAIKVSSH
jgi:hypothetical protein